MSLPNLSFTELAPYLINIELFVIFTLVALVIWLFVRRMADVNQHLSTLQSEYQRKNTSLVHENEVLQQKNEHLSSDNLGWQVAYQRELDAKATLERVCIELQQEMGTLIGNIEREYAEWYRHRWFIVLQKTSLNSVAEITHKIAIPFVVFLGYGLDSFDFQQPLTLGHAKGAKLHQIAICSTNSFQRRRKLFLFQIVESGHHINDELLNEASLFAKAQRVGKYILTNGIKLYVGVHDTPQDRFEVICDIDELAGNWDGIAKELAPTSFVPKTI